MLKAEQRGWIKGRDECWKGDDERACVAEAYRSRIAELQARYRLLPSTGSAVYVCDGQPANEVTATYFATDPPTAIAERGDQVSLMYQQPSGQRRQVSGPERDDLGASGRGDDQLGLRQSGNALRGEAVRHAGLSHRCGQAGRDLGGS